MELEHLGDSAIPVNLKKAVLSCRNDGWSNTLEAWIISLFSLAYADFKGNQNAIISLFGSAWAAYFLFSLEEGFLSLQTGFHNHRIHFPDFPGYSLLML